MIRSNKATAQVDPNSERAINRIVEGTKFTGTVVCESNLRIDGTFEGDIQTKGRLVVGPTGHVHGDIQCANCEIEGKLEGTLTAHQQLTLKRSAKVHGDVQYGQLSVEAGAQVTGSLHLATNVKDMKDRPKQVVSKTDKAPEASKERTA